MSMIAENELIESLRALAAGDQPAVIPPLARIGLLAACRRESEHALRFRSMQAAVVAVAIAIVLIATFIAPPPLSRSVISAILHAFAIGCGALVWRTWLDAAG